MSLSTITLFTFTIVIYFTGLHEAVQGHSVVSSSNLWGIDWPGFPLNLTKQLYSRIPVQVSHLMCHYSIPCYTWNFYLIYLLLILVFHISLATFSFIPLVFLNSKIAHCCFTLELMLSNQVWWTKFVFIAGNTTCLLLKTLSFFHKFYDETLCLSLLQHVMKLYLHDY